MLSTELPSHASALFVLITFGLLHRFVQLVRDVTTNQTYVRVYGGLVLWLIVQAVLSIKGFYLVTSGVPPRLAVAILPPLLFIIYLFNSTWGKKLIEDLSLQNLTYLHISRFFVEIVLFWLFKSGEIPEDMTFEGRNFDILTGISAPIVAYLHFTKQSLSRNALLVWNVIGLLLLLNVVGHGILSAHR